MNWQENILSGLNQAQAQAVKKTDGPSLILAGAGSGKTRTIVHKLAYLVHVKEVPARKIVAVTFTNKAAQEMASRAIDVAGPIATEATIRTYHSLGLFFLRRFSAYLNIPSDFSIWDDSDQQSVINTILKANYKEKFTKTQIRYFANKISSFKDILLAPEQVEDEVDLDELQFDDMLVDIYALYEIQKQKSMALDFADLIYRTVKLFLDNEDVLARVHSRYSYFLVDEYQDTNHAQFKFIELLAQKEQNLCVVGDDDQAIYGWRGADISNILDFKKDFPDAQMIKLEQNYRSTQSILDLSNSIISQMPDRIEKSLFTDIEDGPKPILYTLEDDRAEAHTIASLVTTLNAEIPLHEIALLYRTNGQSRLLEEALMIKKIPYKVYGGISFFGRKEVKDCLAYLKFIRNPHDEVSFLRVVNTPTRGIGDKSVEKLYNYRREQADKRNLIDFLFAMEHAQDAGLSAKASSQLAVVAKMLRLFQKQTDKQSDFSLLFDDLLQKSGLHAMYEEEDQLIGGSRLENLGQLKNSLTDFQHNNPDALLSDYLQDVSLHTNMNDREENTDSLNLMTIHNAKGLEFKVVFIVGLDEDVMPHFLAKRDNNLDEERRLLYVAITRAKEKLYLTRANKRFSQGWVQDTYPSMFLTTIKPDLYEDKGIGVGVGGGGQSSRNSYTRSRSLPAKPKPKIYRSEFKNTISDSSSSNVNEKFKPGDKVSHPSFGNGRVMKLEGTGDATKIHIFFSDSKTRKFILKYTPLKKL